MTFRRVVVAGGGTGGHLFPGLAVVEELRRRAPSVEVTWVGTARGIEARVLPARSEKLELLDVTPLKGQGPTALVRSLGRLPAAVSKARALLRAVAPDLVIGVGGYASGPVLAAAASLGIPTALLEQNAHVGLTNRILARLVGRAYVSFEETRDVFDAAKVRVVGNPVRAELVAAAQRASCDPEGFEARARTVLVLGGSQGASALNRHVPKALADARAATRGLRVLHQTGASMQAEVKAAYDALGVPADVVPFIDDVARAYADATLVIARAGATTLAELCAIGRPSVLVPFPAAADDHQGKNAESLERAGAAVCVREERLEEAGVLVTVLRALLDDPTRRRAMAEAARDRGRPDAAAAIVDDLSEWLGLGFDGGGSDASETGEPSSSGEPGTRAAAATDEGLRGERPYRPSGRPEAGMWARAVEGPRRPLVVGGRVWE